MRSRPLLLQAIVAIALLVAGVFLFRFVTRTDLPTRHVSALEQVRNLLRDRAALLTRGDVEGYLRPLTPKARAFEEPLAKSTTSVPLGEFKVTAIPGRFQEVEGSAFRELLVEFTYQYRDLPDDNKFEYRYVTTIERQGTSWLVTDSHEALPEYGGDDRVVLPVWAQGPTSVDRSGHFLTLYRPGLQHEKEGVELAEKARLAILPRVLLDFDPVHLLVLAGDDVQFKQMARIPANAENPLGIGRFRFTDAKLPHNRYMALNEGALYGRAQVSFHGDASTPLQVAEHELGHLALFRYVTPDTPAWLNEAGAMYLAGERLEADWKRGVAIHGFDALSFVNIELPFPQRPLGATVFNPPPAPSQLEHPFSNAAGYYLIDKAGAKEFFSFYKGYKFLADLRGGLSLAKEAATDIILATHYNIQRPELDVATRDYIQKAVGAPN